MSLPLTPGELDPSQLEILDQRLSDGGLAGVQGPPGTGKSLLMAQEAALAYCLEEKPIVVAAFGNHTVDNVLRFVRALLLSGQFTKIDGDLREHICRVGYTPAIDDDVQCFHTNRPSQFRHAGIIFTTLHSAWRISGKIDAQRIIIDETAQAVPEQAYILIQNALAFAGSRDPINMTIVGDPMQARPISPDRYEVGILSRLAKSSRHRMMMLRTTYREPEPNVNMTSQVFYDGMLEPSDEARSRRLAIGNVPGGWIGNALDSEEPLTFVDTRGAESEEGYGKSNSEQAGIVEQLVRAYASAGVDVNNHDRLLVMSPYRGQVIETRRRLAAAGFSRVSVMSVTKALGLEADITIFQTVRSNSRGNLGMSGWTEIVNVGTSRMRCKLIVIGNMETFAEGRVYDSSTDTAYLSKSRRVARFIERHGHVVTTPTIVR